MIYNASRSCLNMRYFIIIDFIIYIFILCAPRARSSTLFEAIFQPQKLHCHRPNDGRQRRNDRPPLDNQTFVAAAAPLLTPR